ncbi:MAG TPA: hypothetical protein VNN22_08785 [Verrucomicrobiae bacterium]|nr:hypothetical protein [Verrucomicrobiae bacterium]
MTSRTGSRNRTLEIGSSLGAVFSEFPVFTCAGLKRFSTKTKARNKVGFMDEIAPHGAVEEQC